MAVNFYCWAINSGRKNGLLCILHICAVSRFMASIVFVHFIVALKLVAAYEQKSIHVKPWLFQLIYASHRRMVLVAFVLLIPPLCVLLATLLSTYHRQQGHARTITFQYIANKELRSIVCDLTSVVMMTKYLIWLTCYVEFLRILLSVGYTYIYISLTYMYLCFIFTRNGLDVCIYITLNNSTD